MAFITVRSPAIALLRLELISIRKMYSKARHNKITVGKEGRLITGKKWFQNFPFLFFSPFSTPSVIVFYILPKTKYPLASGKGYNKCLYFSRIDEKRIKPEGT